MNFLNPEIKKEPFSIQEDIFILQKKIEIGNKWAEIIKQMPGRTENNTKNRFNMMYKNIKDKFLKNRNHMTVKDLTKGEDIEEVNETQLILELIAEKK